MQLGNLIGNEPWYAGVHVAKSGRVLLTAEGESPRIPGLTSPRTHVRWIGGAQEAGETFVDCARREAREELGCEVELLYPSATWLERTPGVHERTALVDQPPPFIVQRYTTGEWVILYRARLLGEPVPCDVKALLWVPVRVLDTLVDGLKLEQLTDLKIEVLGRVPPAPLLFIGRGGAEDLLRDVGIEDDFNPNSGAPR